MASKVTEQTYALTAANLASIGALDDFYDLYCEVEEICEQVKADNYKAGKLGATDFILYFLTQYNKKEIREACEVLLNKYLYLFSDERPVIYATYFGFKMFTFYHREMPKDGFPGDEILKKITFNEFLIELEIAVYRIFANSALKNNILNKNDDVDFQKEYKKQIVQINPHIKSIFESKKQDYIFDGLDKLPSANKALYVFDRLSSIKCSRENHPVVSTKFIVELVDGGKIVLPAHYCYYCNKYFIGRITLSLFEKSYGKLMIEKIPYIDDLSNFEGFQMESKLHSLGYNVVEGKMSVTERQNLLINLLEKNKISYLEMCSTIEQNIRLFKNSYRHRYAVEKWKMDLKLIGEYIKLK